MTVRRKYIGRIVVSKDMQLTAVGEDAVYHKLTIHPNNGDEAYTENVLKGDTYIPPISEERYPKNAVSYELYTDAAFKESLVSYIKNNGIAGDIDVYVRWIYDGKWVEVDGKYKYQYATDEYAKNQLIVIEDDSSSWGESYTKYYVDENGNRVSNTWIACVADEDAYNLYGIDFWWYFFESEGIAYTSSYGKNYRRKKIRL